MIRELVIIIAILGGWVYWLDKTDAIKNPLVKLAVRLGMLALAVAGIFT